MTEKYVISDRSLEVWSIESIKKMDNGVYSILFFFFWSLTLGWIKMKTRTTHSIRNVNL